MTVEVIQGSPRFLQGDRTQTQLRLLGASKGETNVPGSRQTRGSKLQLKGHRAEEEEEEDEDEEEEHVLRLMTEFQACPC